jgi:hypothetical protein
MSIPAIGDSRVIHLGVLARPQRVDIVRSRRCLGGSVESRRRDRSCCAVTIQASATTSVRATRRRLIVEPYGADTVDCFRVDFGSSTEPVCRLYGERAAGAADVWKNLAVAIAGLAIWFRVRHRTDARAVDDRSITPVVSYVPFENELTARR